MNPLFSEAASSVLRSLLKIGAGFLVARGVWSADEASNYVAAAALGLVGLGWSYWQTYKTRLTLLSALTLPQGATIEDAKLLASTHAAPAVNTPVDEAPKQGRA